MDATRRWLSSLVTGALLAGGLVLAPTSPAAAAGELTLDKTAPSESLLGEDIEYKLTAQNTTGTAQYNLSFSDILPDELKYKAGSAKPAVGEPKITMSGGRQVLTWSNVTDLQANADFALTFEAEYVTPIAKILDPELDNDSNAATSSDPRTVPTFNADGSVKTGSFQASDSATTRKIGVEIEKDEPSPEDELLRGVHDQRTVYTLTIRNNKVVPTEDVNVSDFIPAGMEFLGCGVDDFTTPDTKVEYTGADRLGVPPMTVDDCLTPVSVDTVVDPTSITGIGSLTGTYTSVGWSLGTLTPSQEVTIKYAAGIPLKANTDTWSGTRPDAASLEQGSNLDNNDGASTRELDPESTLTNHAAVSGIFKGEDPVSGDPVDIGTVDATTHTVTIEDLRILKGVTPKTFTPGGVAEFTFTINTSEYMTADGIVVTDFLPDGYCPLGAANYSNANPECDPQAGVGPTVNGSPVTYADVQWVEPNYEITFPTMPAMSNNDTIEVTMPAAMLTTHRKTGQPTVAGDAFRNHVELEGTTTPITGVSDDGIETGPQVVKDSSSAGQTTNLPAIDKTMQPRYFPVDCQDLVTHPYQDYEDLTEAQRTFRKGDTICFKLRVNFPSISTKNAVISDFVPVGTEYIASSYWLTPDNTAPVADFDDSGDPLVWTLGTEQNGAYFVPKDAVFDAVIAVTVLSAPIANRPEIPGNLMKMRTENTQGESESYRDMADYDQAPAPNLAIAKGVRQTTSPVGDFNPPADDKPVREGSVATFQVDVRNRPRPDYPGTEFSARGVQVWDVLPVETPTIDCNSVSNYRYIKPGTATVENLDPSLVTCETTSVNIGGTTKSLPTIKWTMPNPDGPNDYSISTGDTLSLLYDVQIPDPVSVSTKWNNTAYIRQFSAYTNILDVTANYYPEKNIDPAITEDMWDARELKDPSSIYIPNATVGKVGSTEITEDNNNKDKQATIGELVYYEYSVTVPAGSTVYNGRLYDELPTGFDFVSADEWGVKNGTQPAGFTFDTSDGSLEFPETYDNTTGSDQVFYVKATAKVTQAAVPCATEVNPGDPCEVPPAPDTDVPAKNTAKFDSKASLNGSKLPTRQRTYTIDVVQPDPGITKSANPDSVKNSKEKITYTLKATNPVGRSPLHDVVVVDCVPDQVNVEQADIGQGGVKGTNPDCATTDKVSITWTVDPAESLMPGTPREFTYTANIKAGSLPNTQFRNTVALGGTSMPGDVDGERQYVTGANADVLINDGAITKSVTPSQATIGETVTSTIDVNLTDADYENLVVLDEMPVNISTAAGSFETVSVQCFLADADYTTTGPCSTPNPGYIPLDPVGQSLGWSLDSPLPDSDNLRVIRITYTARVTDDATNNKAGDTKTNTAGAYYGYANQPTTMAETANPPETIGTTSDSFAIIEPNVEVTKKVDDEDAIEVVPGQEFEYKVRVTNPDRVIKDVSYGSTAYNLIIVDAVPDGVTPNETTISDGGTFSGGKITWTLASLDVNGSYTFTYKAKLTANTDTTPKVNTVQVTQFLSLPEDPNNPDIRSYVSNEADAQVTPVLPTPVIEKFSTASLAYIGEPYTWEIEVTNPVAQDSPGPTAYEVGVTDTLPPNWEYVPNTSFISLNNVDVSKEPSVAGSPQVLTWSNIGDLPPDGKIVITFDAKPVAPGVITDPGVGLGIEHENGATTDWKNGPPAEGWTTNTSDPVKADTEIAEGDLAIVKSHVTDYDPPIGADEVIPGTSFIWQMDVTNNGPDPFHGPYVVEDTLPAGVNYEKVIGTDWTCQAAAQVVTCTTPDLTLGLEMGESLPTLQLEVSVDPGVTGDLENTATVSGRTYDKDPSNNTDTDKVTTRPLADLTMIKTSSKPYIVGQQVTYTLAVTNMGPSTAAAALTVTDTLPSGLSIASIDAGSWQCSPSSGETLDLTCVLDEDLAPNTQAPLIQVTVDVLESPGAEAQNCAVVESPTEDPKPFDNVGCVSDPVISEVQLELAKKTTGANPVTAGENTEFTITVENLGPAKAKNVQVVDTLEPGLTATSASGKGWTCDVGTGTVVTCTRPNFTLKDSPSDIVIAAKVASSVPAGTTLKNTATVNTSSPQPGGNPPPAISTVEVVAKADLAIMKSHKRQPWTIGKQGRWFMSVTNNGPSDNPGPITVTDRLPRGTEFVSAGGTGWTCEGAARAFTCTHGPLAAGQSTAEFSVLVNVIQGAHPAVVNTATVSSPVPDPNPDNNTATDRVPVLRAPQTAPKLPPSPELIKSGRTEQGQKIRTRVRCLPLKASAAGEVSFCKVRRTKGAVRVEVIGSTPMRVIVTQFAKGTKNFKPWKRVKKYVVRP
jgi:uncharacterized repeat protein (TIGR01451 family)/fimbrial isopeptide formation D2 family protein